MTYKDFYQRQLDISIVAGMNQRFHQKIARRWALCNRVIQVSVAVLAVAALSLTLSGAGHEWEVRAAALAAFMAIALNVFPIGDWAQEHLDLFRRWCDVREEIDCLVLEVEADPIPDEYAKRLRECAKKVQRIGAAEPGLGWGGERLLLKCEIAEKTSRPNLNPDSIPKLIPLPIIVWDWFRRLWHRPPKVG